MQRATTAEELPVANYAEAHPRAERDHHEIFPAAALPALSEGGRGGVVLEVHGQLEGARHLARYVHGERGGPAEVGGVEQLAGRGVERPGGADPEGRSLAVVTLELGAEVHELALQRRPAAFEPGGLLAQALELAGSRNHAERDFRSAEVEADPLFGGRAGCFPFRFCGPVFFRVFHRRLP